MVKKYLVHKDDLRRSDRFLSRPWDKKMISISKASYEIFKASEVKEKIETFRKSFIKTIKKGEWMSWGCDELSLTYFNEKDSIKNLIEEFEEQVKKELENVIEDG